MRYAVEQRMEFIGARLRVAGSVNRSDITAKFRVSVPQASADLQRFMRLHPKAMKYDTSRKTYIVDQALPLTSERDVIAAAQILLRADDEWLRTVAHRDPGMIRDVAAALITRGF
jgi:hypothetical protein